LLERHAINNFAEVPLRGRPAQAAFQSSQIQAGERLLLRALILDFCLDSLSESCSIKRLHVPNKITEDRPIAR
jgi:hypothetical protein